MISASELLDFITPICLEAGQILNKNFGEIQYIKDKSSAIDLCTNADIESEEFIIKKIQEKFPEHSILSEEIGELESDSEYLWVIDPLDGTTNFTHNLPIFAVSIGLVKKEKELYVGLSTIQLQTSSFMLLKIKVPF